MVKAREMPIEAGATYVFDLGYCSFIWWAKLHNEGCRFVTRLRKNSPTHLVEERPVSAGGTVVADRVVRVRERLQHTRRNPLAPVDLREVHVVIDTGKMLRIVSGDLTSPAEGIADLYKTRWPIERREKQPIPPKWSWPYAKPDRSERGCAKANLHATAKPSTRTYRSQPPPRLTGPTRHNPIVFTTCAAG